ncbi:MAG: DNA alkylation repair protein [Saccharofermentans sp.]|nr:DNA alkylation repair protein [Saccharofermentans sp.]
MDIRKIESELFSYQDLSYAQLQIRTIPTVDASRIIGVRTPQLRLFAKRLYKESDTVSFLNELPHKYFDEDQLHAFIISLEKDIDICIANVEAFLPYVDNWATCDQMSPKAFKKDPERLLPYIDEWIRSDKTYTVRFAVGMLMEHFLDERFDTKYADMVAGLRSDEYYINMMIAWYFATALAKQYDACIPYIEEHRLDTWTHNKAIQKSVESYRITDERKLYLKSLKIRKK